MRRALELLVSVVTLLGPVATAAAQISPGPLAAAHRQLEGAGNCGQCHALRKGSVSQMCVNCHREIGWLMARGRGFHARRDAATTKECASCHPDHAGRDFALVSWPDGAAARFDHREAGWALELSHREVKCERCHAPEYRTGPAATLSRRRASTGWIGLETSCVSCHRTDDAHKGALRQDCGTCHDAGDWKRAVRFNHDSTSYALTGEHQKVSCNACHSSARLPVKRDAAGERIPIYAPVPFQQCSSCHRDPHQGRMSSGCGECHTTSGFDRVSKRDFNHALTRYALKGRHVSTPCAGCHGANLAQPRPAFGTCATCHADPHGGEATLRGAVADCAACHRVEGFSPAAYTARDHASAPYPLEGRHLVVSCAGCHRMDSSANAAPRRLRVPSGRCEDCHSDAHAGQLSARTSTSCASCHVVAGWTPSVFAATQHARLSLPLEGRHAEVACNACHAATRRGLPAPRDPSTLGSAGVALRPEAACGSCHVDPHGRPLSTAKGLPPACQDCHDARQWGPSTVDANRHATFSFALEGAHRAVACSACHAELRGQRRGMSTLLLAASGVRQLPFTPRPSTTCASCHETPHGAQFADRRDGGACESCHSVGAFVPADRFDHEKEASFSLKGAHARVACARCHVPTPGATPVTRYRPLSTRCESCHSRQEARS
jgi:hypothetical protein